MSTTEAVQNKVRKILMKHHSVRETDGKMHIRSGSTMVSIGVHPMDENFSFIQLSAPVGIGIKDREGFALWAIQEISTIFGRYALVGDDAFYSHTLLGDYLDEDELLAALDGVAITADLFDDEIVKKYGGKVWAS